MFMKKLISILILFLPLQIISGQDRIVTNQQDTINCLIISVWANHIEYQQKNEDGFMVGKFIPNEQVSEYFRKNQLENHLTFNKEKFIPERRFMFDIQVGGAIMLAFDANEEMKLLNMLAPNSQTKNYITQLKYGWNFSSDIHYLLSDKFGLGLRYSLFASSALQNFTLEYHTNTYLCTELKENLYIHYLAPSLYFYQWIDDFQKFQFNQKLSAGYLY